MDGTCHTGEVMAAALGTLQEQEAGMGCVLGAKDDVVAGRVALGDGEVQCACRAAAVSLLTGLETPGTVCPALVAEGLDLAAEMHLAQRQWAQRASPIQQMQGWAPLVVRWVQRTFPGEEETPGLLLLPPQLPRKPQLRRRRRGRAHWCSLAVGV